MQKEEDEETENVALPAILFYRRREKNVKTSESDTVDKVPKGKGGRSVNRKEEDTKNKPNRNSVQLHVRLNTRL